MIASISFDQSSTDVFVAGKGRQPLTKWRLCGATPLCLDAIPDWTLPGSSRTIKQISGLHQYLVTLDDEGTILYWDAST